MVNYQEVTNAFNIITYVINVFTVLGSVISFIVFSRKAFEKSSIGFYCKWLAIFDLFVIFGFIFGVTSLILEKRIIFFNIYICKIGYFISSGISPITAWILVAFSFDQLIIVSRTERFQFVKQKWFQYSIIIGLFLAHCAIYSPEFVIYGMVNITIQNVTFHSCESSSIIIPVLYLIESSLIPFAILIISMSFVIRFLIQSRKKSLHVSSSKKMRKNECKFAFNSVVLNVLFIVLTSPLVILYIFPIDDYSLSQMIHSLFFIFFNLNFALHFFIHLAFNSVFSREFSILFSNFLKIY